MTKYNFVDVSSVLRIDDWSDLDDALAGSRAKQSYIHPETSQFYIFKEPNERREALIWSELIASFIAGDLLDWEVQHTQIGIKGDKIGNLLRYIFEPEQEVLISGDRLCAGHDPEYDLKEGTRHTWQLIQDIHDSYRDDVFESEGTKRAWTSDYYRYWSRAIAFDTLISNSDRHAENWSLHLPSSPTTSWSNSLMSPLYDNGSSMGCEVDAVGLDRWFDDKGKIIQSKLDQYCRKGRHHLRKGEERFAFQELCTLSLQESVIFRSEYEAIADLDLSRLEGFFDDIIAMTGVPENAQMTSKRQEQITQLLRVGQDRVKRSLVEKA